MYKTFTKTEVEDSPDAEQQPLWPQTKLLFLAMKKCFFILVLVQILAYYAHVYRQATWKFVDVDEKEIKSKKNKKKDGKKE